MNEILTRTISGKLINLHNIQPDDIIIDDIAHALARQCRFGGHVSGVEIYSVAEHSILCQKIADILWKLPIERTPEIRKNFDNYIKFCLSALMHDASEAYLTDVITPVKKNLPEYLEIEERVQVQVEKILGIQSNNGNSSTSMPEKNQAIKIIDRLALCIEASYITVNNGELIEDQINMLPATYQEFFEDVMIGRHNHYIHNFHPRNWNPSRAKQMFLEQYYELHFKI